MIGVGTTVRHSLSSLKFVVVAIDDRFVYVTRADFPKKNQRKECGQVVGRIEFAAEWKVAA